jgi:hypothetical protein
LRCAALLYVALRRVALNLCCLKAQLEIQVHCYTIAGNERGEAMFDLLVRRMNVHEVSPGALKTAFKFRDTELNDLLYSLIKVSG